MNSISSRNFTAASPRERGSMLRLKMQLTEQRVFVVKNYFETISFEIVQQRFQENFPERSSPTKKTIWKKVRKFNNEGTTINLNKNRSGRKKTARTRENINLVLEHRLEEPKI